MIRLHRTLFCATRRMFSSRTPDAKIWTPFLRPRRRKTGSENPFLELAKGKACREPYIKSFLVPGLFDKRLLTYPEVLDDARLESINKLYTKIRGYVDSLSSETLQAGLTDEIRQQLTAFGAFGALIPSEFGGLGLTQTEFARFMEAFGSNMTLATIVMTHNCTVAHLINRYGSDKIKSELLPKLASGVYVGAFATTETTSGSDRSACKSNARSLIGDHSFLINGEKIFVTNGQFADLFLTTCQVEQFSSDVNTESQLSIIAVERNASGVHTTSSNSLLGLNGAGFATVSFQNVSVPQDRVLGRLGDGGKIGLELHNSLRCAMAAAVLGSMKSSFDKLLSGTIVGNTLKPSLQDQHLQQKLNDLASDIYFIESIVYMTSAIEDVVENPDILIEAWAIGLTSLEAGIRVLETCVDLCGSEAFDKRHCVSEALNDLRCLLFYDTPQDLMRLFVSMTSLQFSGAELNSRIQILRDPLTHLKEYMKVVSQLYHDERDSAEKPSDFVPYFHPSLEVEANHVAFLHRFLRKVIRSLLTKFGAELFEYQISVRNLSIAICQLYGLTVTMSRLSRSKTKGLENAALESVLFSTLLKRCDSLIEEVLNDDLQFSGSVAETQLDVIDKLIHDGNYSFEHPLKKNF